MMMMMMMGCWTFVLSISFPDRNPARPAHPPPPAAAAAAAGCKNDDNDDYMAWSSCRLLKVAGLSWFRWMKNRVSWPCSCSIDDRLDFLIEVKQNLIW